MLAILILFVCVYFTDQKLIFKNISNEGIQI